MKEPDVVVPAGDAKIGKGIFDEQCASCHGLDVSLMWLRVTARVLELPLWAVSSAERLERLCSLTVRPWREPESTGLRSICSRIWPTPESTFPETKCPSAVLLVRLKEATSLLTSPQCDRYTQNHHIHTPYPPYQQAQFSPNNHISAF